jgi:hypothetical protein
MMYLANPTGSTNVHAAMRGGGLGYIDTPLQGNIRFEGVTWCADNGCFNDTTFDEDRWFKWLQDNANDASHCLFATAPDVLGDHAATLLRSRPWLPRIRELGYRVAFVAQDTATVASMPWGEFDVLFIGGTTKYKLGPEARSLARYAKEAGMWVHMGRVSSLKRCRYAEAIGCDSVDGTYLKFGPDKNLPNVLGWMRDLLTRPAMFDLIGEVL